MFKLNFRVILFTLAVLALITCSVILAVWFFLIYPATLTRGNGNLTSEDRTLNKFTKIEVNDDIQLNLNQVAQNESATVSAEDNIIKNIKTEVVGDTLRIGFAKYGLFQLNTISPTKSVSVNLNFVDIDSISTSGNITITSTGKVRVQKLDLNTSGSAKITLDLFTNEFNVQASGSGDLNITGTANTQKINMSGLGNYMAKNLESKDVTISISGAGSAKLRADDSLDINISGSGSLEYIGSPKKLTQNISGIGTVKQVSE